MDKKSFHNIVALSDAFHMAVQRDDIERGSRDYFMVSAMLAQAQQLSIVSRHLASIAAQLELITGRKKEG